MERIYLTAEDKVEQYENNLVTVTLKDGTVMEKLEPRRLFPVNKLEEYITLLDSEFVERAVIRKIDDLSPESAAAIRRSLDDYYLVPKITKILSVVEKYGTLRWVVETERGVRGFDIRNRNHDIRINRDFSIRVRDSDDNRYIIEDYRTLDNKSRMLLIADL
ncbi:MAG: DUF1854 domain-containing protein [Clostridia bacterium]|nr:DUF1854 domain-containing protein [Clostridia bacterium]